MFIDPSALLHTKFTFWFPPFSTQNRTEDPRPPACKICVRPCERSASFRTTTYLWVSMRNNHGIPQKNYVFRVMCRTCVCLSARVSFCPVTSVVLIRLLQSACTSKVLPLTLLLTGSHLQCTVIVI